MKSRYDGFSVLEAILVVIGIIILGAVGIVAYNNFVAKPADDGAKTSQDASTTQGETPAINTAADLDEASKSLDDTSFDSDGADQLDADAASF